MASVFSVPLLKATTPTLFIRVTEASDESTANGQFKPLKVDATFDGAIYSKTLNQDDVDSMWESRFHDSDAYRHRNAIITKLFTTQGSDIPSTVPEFQLGAIHQEDGSIKVLLRTTDKLPKTMASFYVASTDTTDNDIFRQWLQEVCSSQKRTLLTVTVQQDDIRSLQSKVLLLEHYNATMEQDYRTIIDDLKAKFSEALAHKKQRIWELMNDKLPDDKLFGLNQEYYDRNKKGDADTFVAAVKRQRTQLTPDDLPKKRKQAPKAEDTPMLKSDTPRLQLKQEPDDSVWPPPQVKIEPELESEAVVVADSGAGAADAVDADISTDISDAESVASDGPPLAPRAPSVIEDSQNDTDYGSE